MNSLTPFNNHRNFWFRDYWQDMFDCHVHHAGDSAGHSKHGRHRAEADRREQWLGGPGGGRTLLVKEGQKRQKHKIRPEKIFRKPCDMSQR